MANCPKTIKLTSILRKIIYNMRTIRISVKNSPFLYDKHAENYIGTELYPFKIGE